MKICAVHIILWPAKCFQKSLTAPLNSYCIFLKKHFPGFSRHVKFSTQDVSKRDFYISRHVCGRGSGQLNRILLLRPSFHFSQILFESVVKLLSPLCLISLTTTRKFSNLFCVRPCLHTTVKLKFLHFYVISILTNKLYFFVNFCPDCAFVIAPLL